MNKQHIVFFDESGSAGANYLDDQPIFTFAAIGLEQSVLKTVEDKFRSLKIERGFKPEQELKGAKIITNRNHVLIKKTVEMLLLEGGAYFFVNVIERRYAMSIFIVESFFDPFYNKLFDNTWTYPLPIKEKLANHFYEHMTADTVKLVAQALIRGEEEGFSQLLSSLIADLRNHRYLGNFDVIRGLEGVRSSLGELAKVTQQVYEAETSSPLRHQKGTIMSPNMSSFVALIMRIEHHYSSIPNQKVNLVFYSSKHFDQSFEDIFKLYKNAESTRIAFPGKTPLILGFTSISDFVVETTLNYPLLECADYIATGYRSVFELALSSAQPSKVNDTLTLFLGLATNVIKTPSFLNFVVSDNLVKRLGATLLKYAPR
jgi:hypothetical protein